MRNRITMKGEFLMLAHTPNDAKQIEGQLRTAGHPLRILVAPGLDSFIDILEKSEIAMVMHDVQFRECNLIQVSEAVARSRPGTPILQLTNDIDARAETEAIGKGAQGVISLADMNHLELVCQREFETYQLRSERDALRFRVADLEKAQVQDLGSANAPGLRVQEGIIVHANDALARGLGFADADELFGFPLMDLVAPDDQNTIKERVKQCLKGKGDDRPVEFVMQSDDGARCQIKAHFRRIEHEGDPAIEIRGQEKRGQVASAGGEAQLDRQQIYDAMRQAQSDGGVTAVVFVSIDEFDRIENRVGFAGAEEIMKEALEILKVDTVDGDGLFRFSLSELVVVGNRDTLDTITDQVKRYQRAIARHIFKAADKEVSCKVSAVLYPLSAEPENPEEVLRRVRSEVKALEKEGGNQLRISGSTAEDLEHKKRSAEWIERIEQALAEDRFDLAFQNIASLAGETRQYSDILLRMIDEKGNEILARDFLPYAEEQGRMPRIDRWVITHAVKALEKQLAEKRDPCFFVRVAEGSLAEGQGFIDWLQDYIGQHPSIVDRLVLVIREAHLQDHMKRAQSVIKTCRSLNVKVALDHFGASRHSHQLLSRLKVDFVKLHPDFAELVGKPGADLEALNTIMDTARQNEVRTIAERVTDANSMARMWQMGVNYIMGSHVHEPDREVTDTKFRLS